MFFHIGLQQLHPSRGWHGRGQGQEAFVGDGRTQILCHDLTLDFGHRHFQSGIGVLSIIVGILFVPMLHVFEALRRPFLSFGFRFGMAGVARVFVDEAMQ